MFFANSGAEANEAAFKLARRTGRGHGGGRRRRLPRPHDGRARRSPASPASASRSSRCPATVTFVPYGDADGAARPRSTRTPPRCSSSRCRARTVSSCRRPATWRRRARSRPRAGALLVLDEVQTGIGRTGALVRAPGARASARTSSPWPRGSAAGCPSAPASRSGARPACSARAPRLDVRRQPGVLRGRARGARHDRGRGPAGPRERGRGAAAATGIEGLGHPLVATCGAPGCCSASCSPTPVAPRVEAAARTPASS